MKIYTGPRGGKFFIKNGRKVYLSSNNSFGKKQVKKTLRTNEKLWKKIVAEVKAGSKGGLSGQWSARKAQYAVMLYKKRGGGYRGKRSSGNKLTKWTREDWGTKSGKPSVVGNKATGERYLPKAARKNLTKKEYARTSRKKRKGMKEGKQYVKQPKKIALKTAKYRRSKR